MDKPRNQEQRTKGTKRKASPDCESRKRTKTNSQEKEKPLARPKNRRLLNILKTDQESSSSGTSREVRTRGTKRKASPDCEFRKRTRKDIEDKVKPLAPIKNRRLLNIFQTDQESSSAGTSRESSCLDIQSSSTSVGDLSRTTAKRKAGTDGEGPQRKRRKRSPVLKAIIEESEEDSVDSRRAAFEAKYRQQGQLGEGGCGSVFVGYRRADNLPVAIKHIPKDKVYVKHKDQNGRQVSIEVAVMEKLGCGSTGSVSLLDWYDLRQELILVLERPMPAQDLLQYINARGSRLEEQEAKIILKQLVDAVVHLHTKNIFHRDIKPENILIETSSDGPRVHLIDFGLSCFFKQRSSYCIFSGTEDHIPPEWYQTSRYTAGPTTVWQLGVVAFETLHRKANFETRRFLRNKLRISKRLSHDCRDFLSMCLAKFPEERPTLEEIKRHPWLS